MSMLSNLFRCGLAAAFWTMLAGAPAPAAADDQPAKTPATSADREQVEQQLRSISEKIGRLEIEGKHDEAEKLKHEAREFLTKAWRSRSDNGGPTSAAPAVSGPEAEKVRQQLKDMSQKIGQLEKDGKHDEAEKLKHEARALYGKLNPHSTDAASPGSAERAQLYQQVRAIRDKINQATKDGNQDEVQRLNKEFEALRSKLYAQSSHGSTRPSSGGDREARLQHLRSAAENLKAAGFEPEAQHLMQLASRIQGDGTATTSPGGSPPSSREYGSSPAVQELRGQVEQMHRELRELRAQLKGKKDSE